METTQVAFIRGFVEKCASKGWKPAQISEALGVLQLNEMFQDPSFRSGFDKQAAGFMDGLKNMTPGQTAAVGAGVGGLGGLVFGGKNRLRNALIGALGGGAAGYGVGKYREGAPARAFGGAARGEAFGAPGTKTPDMGNAGNGGNGGNSKATADAASIFGGAARGEAFGAPGSSTPKDTSYAGNASPNVVGSLRQRATDTTLTPAERLEAVKNLQRVQGVGTDGTSAISAAASGAVAPIVAAKDGIVNIAAVVGKKINDFNTTANQNQLKELNTRLNAEIQAATAGDESAAARAKALQAHIQALSAK